MTDLRLLDRESGPQAFNREPGPRFIIGTRNEEAALSGTDACLSSPSNITPSVESQDRLRELFLAYEMRDCAQLELLRARITAIGLEPATPRTDRILTNLRTAEKRLEQTTQFKPDIVAQLRAVRGLSRIWLKGFEEAGLRLQYSAEQVPWLLFAETAPVVVNRRLLGRYQLVFYLMPDQIQQHYTLLRVGGDSYRNPHMHVTSGSICLGSFRPFMEQALKRCDMAMALAIMVKFLATYRKSDSYAFIERLDPCTTGAEELAYAQS